MKKLLALSLNDTRQIFRDKVLMALWIIPALVLLFILYAMPAIVGQYSVVDIYYPVVIAVLCATNAAFPAFIVSFIFLDEKDEGVLTALRVMPVSVHAFVLYRMGFITLLAFVIALSTLLVSGLSLSNSQMVALAFLCSMNAPFTSLVVISKAANKIEGVTLLKGLNMLIMLPLLAFFIPGEMQYILGIIPVFWVYQAVQVIASSEFNIFILSGIIVSALWIAIFYRRFMRVVF